MDFHSMKRKDLQALCKKHNIPANGTNLAMADKLASLLKKPDAEPKKKKVRFCLDEVTEEVIDLTKSEEKIEKPNLGKIKSSMKPGFERSNQEIHEVPARSTRSRRASMGDALVVPVQKRKWDRDNVGDRKEEEEPVVDVRVTKLLRSQEIVKDLEKGKNPEKEIPKEVENAPRRSTRRGLKTVVSQSEEEVREDVTTEENVIREAAAETIDLTKSEEKIEKPDLGKMKSSVKPGFPKSNEEIHEVPARSTRSRRLSVVPALVPQYPVQNRKRRRENVEDTKEQEPIVIPSSTLVEITNTRNTDNESDVRVTKSLRSREIVPNLEKVNHPEKEIPKEPVEAPRRPTRRVSKSVASQSGEQVRESVTATENVFREGIITEKAPWKSTRRASKPVTSQPEQQVREDVMTTENVFREGIVTEKAPKKFTRRESKTAASQPEQQVREDVTTKEKVLREDIVTEKAPRKSTRMASKKVASQSVEQVKENVTMTENMFREDILTEKAPRKFTRRASKTVASQSVEKVKEDVTTTENMFREDIATEKAPRKSTRRASKTVASQSEEQVREDVTTTENMFREDTVTEKAPRKSTRRALKTVASQSEEPVREDLTTTENVFREDIVTQVSLGNDDDNQQQQNVDTICKVSQTEEPVEKISDESAEEHLRVAPSVMLQKSPLLHSSSSDSARLCQELSEKKSLQQVEKDRIIDGVTTDISEFEFSSDSKEVQTKDVMEEVDFSNLSAKSLCDGDSRIQGDNESKSFLSGYKHKEKVGDEVIPYDRNDFSINLFEKSPEEIEHHAEESNYNCVDPKTLFDSVGVETLQQNIKEVNDPTNQMVEAEVVATGFEGSVLVIKEHCDSGKVNAERSPFLRSENYMENHSKGPGDAEPKLVDHVSEVHSEMLQESTALAREGSTNATYCSYDSSPSRIITPVPQESSKTYHLTQVEEEQINDDVATGCIAESVSNVFDFSSGYTDAKAKDIVVEVDLSYISAKSLCNNDTCSQGGKEPESSLSDFVFEEKDTGELDHDEQNGNSIISFEKLPRGLEQHAEESNFSDETLEPKETLDLGVVGTSQENDLPTNEIVGSEDVANEFQVCIEELCNTGNVNTARSPLFCSENPIENDPKDSGVVGASQENDLPTNEMVESEEVANEFQVCIEELCNTGNVNTARSPLFCSENPIKNDPKDSGEAETKFEDHVSETCSVMLPESTSLARESSNNVTYCCYTSSPSRYITPSSLESSDLKPLKQVQKELVRSKKEKVPNLDLITDHVTDACNSNTRIPIEENKITENVSDSEAEDKSISTPLHVQESSDLKPLKQVQKELVRSKKEKVPNLNLITDHVTDACNSNTSIPIEENKITENISDSEAEDKSISTPLHVQESSETKPLKQVQKELVRLRKEEVLRMDWITDHVAEDCTPNTSTPIEGIAMTGKASESEDKIVITSLHLQEEFSPTVNRLQVPKNQTALEFTVTTPPHVSNDYRNSGEVHEELHKVSSDLNELDCEVSIQRQIKIGELVLESEEELQPNEDTMIEQFHTSENVPSVQEEVGKPVSSEMEFSLEYADIAIKEKVTKEVDASLLFEKSTVEVDYPGDSGCNTSVQGINEPCKVGKGDVASNLNVHVAVSLEESKSTEDSMDGKDFVDVESSSDGTLQQNMEEFDDPQNQTIEDEYRSDVSGQGIKDLSDFGRENGGSSPLCSSGSSMEPDSSPGDTELKSDNVGESHVARFDRDVCENDLMFTEGDVDREENVVNSEGSASTSTQDLEESCDKEKNIRQSNEEGNYCSVSLLEINDPSEVEKEDFHNKWQTGVEALTDSCMDSTIVSSCSTKVPKEFRLSSSGDGGSGCGTDGNDFSGLKFHMFCGNSTENDNATFVSGSASKADVNEGHVPAQERFFDALRRTENDDYINQREVDLSEDDSPRNSIESSSCASHSSLKNELPNQGDIGSGLETDDFEFSELEIRIFSGNSAENDDAAFICESESRDGSIAKSCGVENDDDYMNVTNQTYVELSGENTPRNSTRISYGSHSLLENQEANKESSETKPLKQLQKELVRLRDNITEQMVEEEVLNLSSSPQETLPTSVIHTKMPENQNDLDLIWDSPPSASVHRRNAAEENQPSGCHVSILGIYETCEVEKENIVGSPLCSSKSISENGSGSQGEKEQTSSADNKMSSGESFDAISQDIVEESFNQENNLIQYYEDKNCCSISKAVSSEKDYSELEISPATGTQSYAPANLVENEVISEGNDETIDGFSEWEISLFSEDNVGNHNANTERVEAVANETSENNSSDALQQEPVPKLCSKEESSIKETTPKTVRRRDVMDDINSNLRKMHISSALKEKRFSIVPTRMFVPNEMKENVPNSILKQPSGTPMIGKSVMKRKALEDLQNTTSKRSNSIIH